MGTSDQGIREGKTLVLSVTEGLLDQLRGVGVGEAVIDVRGLSAGLDDLGAAQQREVPADRALRLSQGLDEPGHTTLARNQQQDQPHPDRFRQGPEDPSDPRQIVCTWSFRHGMGSHTGTLTSAYPNKQT
jgi:hypothetical protein